MRSHDSLSCMHDAKAKFSNGLLRAEVPVKDKCSPALEIEVKQKQKYKDRAGICKLNRCMYNYRI